VRQQLLCAERADYTVWTGLCPAFLPFAVALCPAVFGRYINRAFSILHVVSSSRSAFAQLIPRRGFFDAFPFTRLRSH